MVRFCSELEWNGSPLAQACVRAIESESLFYYLHKLCGKLNAGGGAEGHRRWRSISHHCGRGILALAPPSRRRTMVIFRRDRSALLRLCTTNPIERVLQVLMSVYLIEGRLSVWKPNGLTTGAGSGLCETFSTVEGDASSSEPHTSLASPTSKVASWRPKGEILREGGISQLDMTLGLMAPRLLDLSQSICGIVR